MAPRGEPLSCKDALLLAQALHLDLDGLNVAAAAASADKDFIYARRAWYRRCSTPSTSGRRWIHHLGARRLALRRQLTTGPAIRRSMVTSASRQISETDI
jgi:hypothetical protein